jgi:putative transposase
MRKSRFTEEQIALALRQVDAGVPVADLCRKLGISEPTFYAWKKKYAGMGIVEMRRVKGLEDENRRLKTMVADQALDIQALRHLLGKK